MAVKYHLHVRFCSPSSQSDVIFDKNNRAQSFISFYLMPKLCLFCFVIKKLKSLAIALFYGTRKSWRVY
jgi:hypothetical protein